ncbi:hypothetical protein Nepgr_021745 [Nepenthes gracilis]|uniref:Two-component response regulator n=1 Tax=Nepenthes gracilis TaxID=150966 RepID=A0AAD3XXC2_NEPGR|nr:hypothetical protein Nepgr_021745 [Nepenthes gracilis]
MKFGGGAAGSMSLPGSSVARQKDGAADAVSDQFPAGLRVLVVDDDPTCLTILDKMLRTCRYEVTKCNRAEVALSLLRENKNGYDVVISDVHMPDMDGFKLLEHIGLEMDLPVIMMSADDSKNVVMKGVTHGACDYLIKPVRIEALKNIWQHVVRKKKNGWKELEQPGRLDDGDRQQKQEDLDNLSPSNEGSWKTSKRKGEEDEGEEKDDMATLKKPRVVWSAELHQQFVVAVNQLGIDKAVPKKILELMNVTGLTRENVASHLQKYRLYLRRLSGVSQHQGGLNNSFLGPQETSFGMMPSLGGIDLRTLTVAGQLPAQTLASYQASGLTRAALKPSIAMPFVDQRDSLSIEIPKLKFGEGQKQQQQLSTTNTKHINLLQGIPMTMEQKQLVSFQQSPQLSGTLNNLHGGGQNSSLLRQMVQPQSQGEMLNESIGGQMSLIQSSIGQPIPRNRVSNSDYSVNHMADLPHNGFPLSSTPVITPLSSKGFKQEGISSDMQGEKVFAQSYDVFDNLHQHKTQNWQLQNAALNYGAASRYPTTSLGNAVNVSPSVLVHQAFSLANHKNGHNGDCHVGKTISFAGAEEQFGGTTNIDRNANCLLTNIPSRVKVERVQEMSSRTNLFSDHFGHDDLMSALLKQQEDLGQVESEFDFDGYTMDNIPV